MIVLPSFPPLPVWLISFWLVINAAAAIVLGIALALMVSPIWILPVVALACASGAVGIKWPGRVAFVYRVWNKLAREFSTLARLYVSACCFYSICLCAALAGSFLRIAPGAQGESFWVPRAPLSHGYAEMVGGGSGWVSNYLSWCVKSHNFWAICLIPFLLTLALLDSGQTEDKLPTNTYTLY